MPRTWAGASGASTSVTRQAAADLVWGGVFASIGNGDLAVKTDVTKNRRFFYAPDVSLIESGTLNFINVAIGSGHREKPITDVTVVESLLQPA